MKTKVTLEELWEAQTKQHIHGLRKENKDLREVLKYLCETSMDMIGSYKHSDEAWFDDTTRYTDAYIKSIQILAKQPK